jgi:hypothetical protein
MSAGSKYRLDLQVSLALHQSIPGGRREGYCLQIGSTTCSKTSLITCPTARLNALNSSGEVRCSTDRIASSVWSLMLRNI